MSINGVGALAIIKKMKNLQLFVPHHSMLGISNFEQLVVVRDPPFELQMSPCEVSSLRSK